MNFDLLNGVRPLALLLVVDAALLALLAYPLRRRYPDDQGDGLALVLLPRPVLPSYWRVPAFAGLFLVLFVGYHSLRGAYSPDQIYAEWVTRVCDSVVRSPAEISGYLAGFTLGLAVPHRREHRLLRRGRARQPCPARRGGRRRRSSTS